MTFLPDGPVHDLCAAADEALTVAAFCTGDFTAADRLFTEARARAVTAGDRAGEAFAVGGLGMVLHHRNLAKLIDGAAPAGADVDAEEELMRRALTIWQGLPPARRRAAEPGRGRGPRGEPAAVAHPRCRAEPARSRGPEAGTTGPGAVTRRVQPGPRSDASQCSGRR